jgi:hypothetical protein
VEKLRPEQRKLWRKTYHQERDRGEKPTVAADRANDAVNLWESAGAFDESEVGRTDPERDICVGVQRLQVRRLQDGARAIVEHVSPYCGPSGMALLLVTDAGVPAYMNHRWVDLSELARSSSLLES